MDELYNSGTPEAFEFELTELATDAYALALNALELYGRANPICNKMGAIANELRKLAGIVEIVNHEETRP